MKILPNLQFSIFFNINFQFFMNIIILSKAYYYKKINKIETILQLLFNKKNIYIFFFYLIIKLLI